MNQDIAILFLKYLSYMNGFEFTLASFADLEDSSTKKRFCLKESTIISRTKMVMTYQLLLEMRILILMSKRLAL